MRKALFIFVFALPLAGCALFSDPVIEACEGFDAVVSIGEEEMAASRATSDAEKSSEEWQEIQRTKFVALMGAKSDALYELSAAVSETGKGSRTLLDSSLSGATSWGEMANLLSIENSSDWDLIQKATSDEITVLNECKDYGASIENGS
jgi:hypothetical protein